MARQLPEWAAANPVIMGLLEYVLEKRDKQILSGDEKPISVTLNPQNPPRALRAALAPFNDPTHDDGLLWDELKWLANEYRCFSIRPAGRRSAGRAPWEGARLSFRDASEPLIRDWLQRPRPLLVNPQWRMALARFEGYFENVDAFPVDGLDLEPGFEDFEELLACWSSIGRELETSSNMSWRQLSARCFLGDSKYLDSGWRQSLVSALFPSMGNRIRERPLLMHLYLPAQMERVLLIENQDTFLWLADLEPAVTALVYIEGYRGGAARVRAPALPDSVP
ncbi:hypothetical protein [Microbulbifer taiwanensis]|uniref:hypothetical protein n=1 Tax=Microbulbifer taiwanensis TaxID=986746 RepID=UPI00361FF9E8